MAEIWVIEDDPEINGLVSLHLRKAGHQVVSLLTGFDLEDEDLATADLFLLDVMLPVLDGFHLIPIIRRKTRAPILLLTALDGEEAKVRGFDAGADDYVVKPFGIAELLGRVRAHLRRSDMFLGSQARDRILGNGWLEMQPGAYRVTLRGQPLSVNPIEFKMLKVFLENAGRVVSKEQLYEQAWEEPWRNDDNTLMVHIRRLREKIEENPGKPVMLTTIRGAGYRLERG